VLGSAVGAFAISTWQTYGVELEAKRLAEKAVANAELTAEEANQRAAESELILKKQRNTTADSYELLSVTLNALRDHINGIDEDVEDCLEMIPITEMLREDAVRRMGARTVEMKEEEFSDPENTSRNPISAENEPGPSEKIDNFIKALAIKRDKPKPKSKRLHPRLREIIQIPPRFDFYE